jgi:NADH-ubiquinone oxidoreductase chain 1
LIIVVLINVAFITLLERKILGYSQLRKGPNKVRVGGILQPFNDAIKLFSKETVFPLSANNLIYLIRPAIAIILALIIYLRFPLKETLISISLSLLFIYTIFRINVYPTLLSG